MSSAIREQTLGKYVHIHAKDEQMLEITVWTSWSRDIPVLTNLLFGFNLAAFFVRSLIRNLVKMYPMKLGTANFPSRLKAISEILENGEITTVLTFCYAKEPDMLPMPQR